MYAEPMFNAAKLIINLVSYNVLLFKNLTERPYNSGSDTFLQDCHNVCPSLIMWEQGAVPLLVELIVHFCNLSCANLPEFQ